MRRARTNRRGVWPRRNASPSYNNGSRRPRDSSTANRHRFDLSRRRMAPQKCRSSFLRETKRPVWLIACDRWSANRDPLTRSSWWTTTRPMARAPLPKASAVRPFRRRRERWSTHDSLLSADELPQGWSGKCNAAWSGAKSAKGKWLLFTDADTRHAPDSIARGIAGGARNGCGHAVVLAEAGSSRACRTGPDAGDFCRAGDDVSAQGSVRPEFAGSGGQRAIPADSARCVRRCGRTCRRGDSASGRRGAGETGEAGGIPLRFGMSDAVSTRMYRSFPQMWEGWTKNLALLFPAAVLALWRASSLWLIVAMAGVFAGCAGRWRT